MCELRRLQQAKRRSLGCIRPCDVRDLLIEPVSEDWEGRKKSVVDQLALFDPVETKLEKIPYIFRYHYRCEDPSCPGHKQSIHDWELMELYRKLRNQHATENETLEGLREKFVGELCRADKDTHFFVGNVAKHPSSFIVLGTFWPPKVQRQREMF
jgi:hypothetical protein